MNRFYTTPDNIIGDIISITGSDVNHIKNVLRMSIGDNIVICNGQGKDCYCIINKISDIEVKATILSTSDTDTELKSGIILFQGIPKKDKMELIIQKSIELGVTEIVPVLTKRCVVKLEDPKKEAKKLERWQSIAEGAAKQSGRGFIPKVSNVINFKEAVVKASNLDIALIPYENAKGIEHTKDVVNNIGQYKSIGIIIGPEGGFEATEIEMASANSVIPITLGRRILRTETAGFALISMIMLSLEE